MLPLMRRPIALGLVLAACSPTEIDPSAHRPRLDLPAENSGTNPPPIVAPPSGSSSGSASTTMLPVRGGHLTFLAKTEGRFAAASDPNGPRVWIVNLSSGAVRTVELVEGDVPGRIAETRAGF